MRLGNNFLMYSYSIKVSVFKMAEEKINKSAVVVCKVLEPTKILTIIVLRQLLLETWIALHTCMKQTRALGAHTPRARSIMQLWTYIVDDLYLHIDGWCILIVGTVEGCGYDVHQKHTICDACRPCHSIRSTVRPVFHQIRQICCAYESLLLLLTTTTTEPITLPFAHARGVMNIA